MLPPVRVSRATFLEMCGLALLGARADARALVGVGAVHANEAEASRPRGEFRVQDATALLFLQHVNTPFAVRSADGTRARFVLTEVVERPVSRNVEQFSLIFHASPGTPVHDGTLALEHQALGEFDLFVVSVGAANPRRTVYQACFSRHLTTRETRRRDAVSGRPALLRT